MTETENTLKASKKKLQRSLRFAAWKLTARSFLDSLRFGSGKLERFASAFIFAGMFFLIILGISAISGEKIEYAVLMGSVALFSILSMGLFFIAGPSDGSISAEIKRLEESLVHIDAEIDKAENISAIAVCQTTRKAPLYLPVDTKRERVFRGQLVPQNKCRSCEENIDANAAYCASCGESQSAQTKHTIVYIDRRSPDGGVAAVLSFLFPGLGQIYKGEVLAGILWWIVTNGLYAASVFLFLACCLGIVILPFALLVHIACILDAASSSNR